MLPYALRTYDYLERSRGMALNWTRQLGEAAYHQPFDIGAGSLGNILTHIMISEWYYVQRMQRADVPPYEEWNIRYEDPPPLAELEARWTEQANDTRSTLGAVTDWFSSFDYQVTDDTGARLIVTTSVADLFTQLALHESYHRAQVVNILRRLGVSLEETDFNALMWPRRAAE